LLLLDIQSSCCLGPKKSGKYRHKNDLMEIADANA
jgi:hypothetical protein